MRSTNGIIKGNDRSNQNLHSTTQVLRFHAEGRTNAAHPTMLDVGRAGPKISTSTGATQLLNGAWHNNADVISR